MSSMRLQKYLASHGLGSRRRCEEFIAGGDVLVNAKPATRLGVCIDPETDRVTFRGRDLLPLAPAAARVVLLHKPRGYACTSGADQGKTIYELLPAAGAPLRYAGRLDKSSEGLVVLTDSGDLVNRLTHPRYGQRKVYRVTVSGHVGRKTLAALGESMTIDGYATRPAEVAILRRGETPGRTVLSFTLAEGRNRQVRAMCEQVGLRVHRLVRLAVGPLRLTGLESGQWRELSAAEVAKLLPSGGASK